MQQQELAQIRQREANLTALAAIGPRKKRKMDSPVKGSSAEVREPFPKDQGAYEISISPKMMVFFTLGLTVLHEGTCIGYEEI